MQLNISTSSIWEMCIYKNNYYKISFDNFDNIAENIVSVILVLTV